MNIGIDMGGTKIAAGLVKNGKIIKHIKVPTYASQGKAVVLKQLRHCIDELSKGQKIKRIGIGVPGAYSGTKITFLTNIPSLNGVDLKKALGIKVPLILENDSRSFALAEHRYGAGKGAASMIGIILGTGVGSGIIIDGKLHHGLRNMGGEIGHLLVDTALHTYVPGHDGGWNNLLCGPSIVRRHRARGGTEDHPAAIWSSKSAAAKRTREETVQMLAIFIAGLCYAIDPEVIVIGGGVSNLPIAGPVNKLLPKYGAKPIVKHSKLGENAGIIGVTIV